MKKLIFTVILSLLTLSAVFSQTELDGNFSVTGKKYSISYEKRRDVSGNEEVSRWFATIFRNGKSWELRLPVADYEVKNLSVPKFSETAEGFSLSFGWGGGRYFWHVDFFFKEIGGEPNLYKVLSTVDECLSFKDDDWKTDTQTRAINPPLKITDLDTEKINALLGRGEIYTTLVTCSDSDFNNEIKDKTMHLEVWRDRKWIQSLEYKYTEDFAELFGIKKKFKMVDLNFDGYADILILAGCTAGGAQPYYEAFFWNAEKGQFDFAPPFWQTVTNTNLKCDSENRLLYSSWLHTSGVMTYYIYEFADGKYKEKAALFHNIETGLYSYEFNWNPQKEDGGINWFSYEDLSEEWKRVLEFDGFDF